MVDIIKFGYCRKFFNKKTEFRIVQLALRLYRALSAPFWSTFSLGGHAPSLSILHGMSLCLLYDKDNLYAY